MRKFFTEVLDYFLYISAGLVVGAVVATVGFYFVSFLETL